MSFGCLNRNPNRNPFRFAKTEVIVGYPKNPRIPHVCVVAVVVVVVAVSVCLCATPVEPYVGGSLPPCSVLASVFSVSMFRIPEEPTAVSVYEYFQVVLYKNNIFVVFYVVFLGTEVLGYGTERSEICRFAAHSAALLLSA